MSSHQQLLLISACILGFGSMEFVTRRYQASVSGKATAEPRTQASKGSACPRLQRGHAKAARKAPKKPARKPARKAPAKGKGKKK